MSPNDSMLKTNYLPVKHWYKKIKSKATIYEEISHISKRRLQDIYGNTNLKKQAFGLYLDCFQSLKAVTK